MSSLRVTEIYPSIQGESNWAGWPCVFIRLTGCPLRCRWCDTVYSFTEGDRYTVEEILTKTRSFGLDLVEVTGGEPLAQKGAPELLARLADEFETVLLETSGAYPIHDLDPRVRVIVDFKAPGSGEQSRNDLKNVEALKTGDEVKIVLADRSDYDWAKQFLREHPRLEEFPVHFSPVHGELSPKQLAEWLLTDRLKVHLQLQQHKYIWDPAARGV